MNSSDFNHTLIVRFLGKQAYQPIWQAMKLFTETRDKKTIDEFWILEHDAVFTQGQAGKKEHVLTPGDIPVIQVDRGGQVTYHGLGQLIVYLLIDIKRIKKGVRDVVSAIEQSVIDTLNEYGIDAYACKSAPGVYIKNAKISALGLRFRRHCSYHGLSLNLDMDLEPFDRINPCGYQGLEVTQLKDHVKKFEKIQVINQLLTHIMNQLAYQKVIKKAYELPNQLRHLVAK